MAKAKTAAVADSGFQIFDKPGTKDRLAVNFETGTVIEGDGKGRVAFFIHGTRHVVLTDSPVEELAGLEPAEAADE